MLKFFRRLSAPGVNEVEVKPARQENILDTVSHVAQRDIPAQSLREAEPLDKTVDLQPCEKQNAVGQIDDHFCSDEEELARETAAMCIVSDREADSGRNQKPVPNKRKHLLLDGSVSSSSDDEVGDILRGGAWVTASKSDSSRLLRMSRHSACKSPNKKQRRDVRPFLNFEKMRQSRFSTGFRRVLSPRSKEPRVYSLQISGLGTSRRKVTPLVLDAKDEPILTFPVIPQSCNQLEIAPRCY